MAFLSSLDIAVSGMSAQRLRLDIISQNVANAVTTSTSEDEAYRRQVVVFAEDKSHQNITVKEFVRNHTSLTEGSKFSSILEMKLSERKDYKGNGVVCTRIVEDETPLTPVYDPTHPDANEDGYYYLPNVDVEEEQIDALAATNAYDANLTIFNSLRTMAQKALTIGSR